jgi:hypothetical protein
MLAVWNGHRELELRLKASVFMLTAMVLCAEQPKLFDVIAVYVVFDVGVTTIGLTVEFIGSQVNELTPNNVAVNVLLVPGQTVEYVFANPIPGLGSAVTCTVIVFKHPAWLHATAEYTVVTVGDTVAKVPVTDIGAR